MSMKEVEEKLSEFTRKISCYATGLPQFFLCWENTDREEDEAERYENVPAYFDLSVRGYNSKMGDVDLGFVYDRQTKHIKLVASHYANDDYVIYEHDNLDEMTSSDECDMIIAFKSIEPLYDSLKHIMMLDAQKKQYYSEIRRVCEEVFGWE